ncbi:SPFH domain-containing protein [Streptomyces sp. NPDC057718]|uniref:SPFH domain-containing protein n=1 Tax=Streptomyces sp. NPDC057718 TaxID=3346225 RepID=UPI0036C557E8
MTPNDNHTPHTTPAPHSLDDQLPPSLFARPGKGTPPPLFGPVREEAVPPGGGETSPRRDAELLPPLPTRADRGTPPPLFGPVREEAVPPAGDETPLRPDAELPPSPDGDKAPPVPPRPAAPEPPSVSLHLGPGPDHATGGPAAGSVSEEPASDSASGSGSGSRGPASDSASGSGSGRPVLGSAPNPAPDRPVPDRPAPDRPAPDRPAPDRPAPDRPAAARPAPLDGNLHLKPVRRLRTEPSAEWTPHPSYGAEPESPKRESRDDAGPDTELDLVLDLAPGDRAASATFSVPVPGPTPASQTTAPTAAPVTATASVTATTATTTPYPGRRHSVIANETTASIPVHLLFRDDRDDREPADGAAALPGPGAVVHRPATGDRAPATRRPPVPRSPQTRVQPSTRPAPVADPRLTERPGPALSGYAALLAGAAGIAGGLAVLWWRGVLPAAWQSAVGLTPRPDLGIGVGAWAALALLATAVLLALGGLGRGRVGYAWVLTLFGDYRGSVRRTGLVWVSPLLLRRRVDVRLRHWRSEPLPAVDANGTALRVVVLVVWRIKDTVRAVLGIEDHEAYLSAQVEAAMARVLSQLPADAFHEDAPTLRDAEAVGDALTRMLKADCEPVGVEVYSAQPTGIEYAPEVAAAMQRRRIAAIDSRHRDSVLTSVVDAVDDTVNRLTTRGIVELDDYERKALVKDLTVAFYTGRSGGGDGA